MPKVSNEKIVNKLEGKLKSGATNALKFARDQKLSHGKAQVLKMTLSVVLYTATIIGVIILYSIESQRMPRGDVEFLDTSRPLHLKFQLKECLVDLITGDQDGLHYFRTTADLSAGPALTLSGAGTAQDGLTLGCVGPSNEAGDDETVQVKIGQDVVLQSVEVSFEGDGGMVRVKDIEINGRFDVRGTYGIVQLDGDKAAEIEIQLDQGYIGFVNSDFGSASLVLGEEVDFYSWQNTDAMGMEVKIETVETGNESKGLCVSDNTTRPILQTAEDDTHDVYFTLGQPPYRTVEITRKNGNNRLVFSHGVWMSDRNCNNTFDTFANAWDVKPTLGLGFKPWAAQAFDAGMELMNLWLVGSSLGLDTQSTESTGMWIYTTTGSGLLWFPMHIWRVFTLGIMEPRAQRQVAIVQDYTCLLSYAKLVQGKSTCRPDVTSEAAVVSNLKRVQASAIRNGLPKELNLTNAPNSRIYYVQDVPVQSTAWPALADGTVSILTTQTGSFVKNVNGRGYFSGLVGAFFIVALVFLPIVGGLFVCILVGMLYKMEKRRYLRARGTDKTESQAWGSAKSPVSGATKTSRPSIYSNRFSPDVAEQIQEYVEDEAKSNLLLTLVRCLILRSPAGGTQLSVKQVIQMVLGHFLVMQLLVSPFVLTAVLTLDDLGATRALCGHNAWVKGMCMNNQLQAFSLVLLILGLVFEGIYFLNSILEYTTRYGLDMLESTGAAPSCYLKLMRLRSSKVYSKTLSAVQSFTLFIFCGYFILVALFILLGTLLHPSQLAPVLLSISGAAIVGQQITVKFNEIVEKAKKIAAEMLMKAKGFVKEGEQMIKGVAGDVLEKIPGGAKASAMLANAIPSADQMIELATAQAESAMDSVQSPQDLHRLLVEAPQQAAARSFAAMSGAAQMVKGIATNNVGDVVKMLQTMASKNPAAATQMLQAAVTNHRESGIMMVKELVALNPSGAAQILKGMSGASVADLREALPFDQAQLLDEALREVGFDADAEVTEVKVVAEDATVPGAVSQFEAMASSNTTDIAANLQELAASNPDAASQMLQALSAGHSRSGASKIMQEMAAINPSSAAQMLKGVAAGDLDAAVEMLEALSGTDQAKYLEQALSDAGLPVNMADLANFKTAIEEARKFAANPLEAARQAAGMAPAKQDEDLGRALGEARKAAAAVQDLAGDAELSGEAEDFEENLLMMLGLSKGQLILLNIQAVLIFLSWVGFMLMGAYLFLGSEALIPQLTANVSAVGGAVTLIRSKSSELKSGDLKSIQSTMQAASSELKAKSSAPSEKKTQ